MRLTRSASDSPKSCDWPLPKIDHLGVQEWVAELGRRPAPATVRECHRVLSLVLRSAVQTGRLAGRPPDRRRFHDVRHSYATWLCRTVSRRASCSVLVDSLLPKEEDEDGAS